MGIWTLGGDIQEGPENMRHNDFFTSYMRPNENTRPRLKDLIKFNWLHKFPSRLLSLIFF